MERVAQEECAALVGLDWADAKHDVCLQAAGTAQREFLSLEHSPEAINAWVQTLRTRFNGQSVAVCLGLSKHFRRGDRLPAAAVVLADPRFIEAQGVQPLDQL